MPQSIDYKEIRRRISEVIDPNVGDFIPAHKNLVKDYDENDMVHIKEAIDYVRDKSNSKVLVVGSASLDYLFQLQFLTGKTVCGIDVSPAVVHMQKRRMHAIRKAKNYDELGRILGERKISNFKERNILANEYKVWIPFGKLRGIRDDILPIRADAHIQPFADRTFDFVFSDCTIDYSPQPIDFFKELLRVLDRNGHLIMQLISYSPTHPITISVYNKMYEYAQKVSSRVTYSHSTLHAVKS